MKRRGICGMIGDEEDDAVRKRACLFKVLAVLAVLVLGMSGLTGCASYTEANQEEGQEQSQELDEGSGDAEADADQSEASDEDSAEDINLRDANGGGYYYLFTYKDEDYTAIYSYDNWCVYDSYKITSGRAMKKICQALIEVHPVHGSDYESFRTAEDMVYEWKQHNIAHAILPEDNPWKTTTGNVDFDPEDQGKSMREMYKDRTGEDFDIAEHKDDILRYIKSLLE